MIGQNSPRMEPRIRPITPNDDPRVAELTRRVMREFDCVGDGFAFVDPELACMSEAYSSDGARFYVVEDSAGVSGCGGFAPLEGTDPTERICELRKMYFDRHLRGHGLGAKFLDFLLEEMRRAGFERCYLETTTQMDAARALYVSRGFVERPHPLGATGHCGCDRFLVRDL